MKRIEEQKQPVVVGKACSFLEMMEEVKAANEKAIETHRENGGMCQNCGKNKADFPDGQPNPFHCRPCNEDTEKLLKELRKDPGFMEF